MKRMYMFFVALALVILAFSPAEAQRKNTTKHDVAPINMSMEKQKLSEQENMHKFDKKECNCRKPQVGMIQKACEDYSIDMGRSYIIGDRASDVLLGKNAGLTTVLLESGYGTKRLEQEVTPDYIMKDLRDIISLL